MQKDNDDIPQFDPGSPDPAALAFFLFAAAMAVCLIIRVVIHFVG